MCQSVYGVPVGVCVFSVVPWFFNVFPPDFPPDFGSALDFNFEQLGGSILTTGKELSLKNLKNVVELAVL